VVTPWNQAVLWVVRTLNADATFTAAVAGGRAYFRVVDRVVNTGPNIGSNPGKPGVAVRLQSTREPIAANVSTGQAQTQTVTVATSLGQRTENTSQLEVVAARMIELLNKQAYHDFSGGRIDECRYLTTIESLDDLEDKPLINWTLLWQVVVSVA
jgi:hypothetical protein